MKPVLFIFISRKPRGSLGYELPTYFVCHKIWDYQPLRWARENSSACRALALHSLAMPPSSLCDNQKCLQTLSNVPQVAKLPLFENHWFKPKQPEYHRHTSHIINVKKKKNHREILHSLSCTAWEVWPEGRGWLFLPMLSSGAAPSQTPGETDRKLNLDHENQAIKDHGFLPTN